MDETLVVDGDGTPVTADLVLSAYRARCFPMGEEREGVFRWYRPPRRAVLRWPDFRIPRSLAKTLRKAPYRISIDEAFDRVIAACADRTQTWICRGIESVFQVLHRQGHAHSVEAWDAAGELVGGLYGLAIGGCFCGESMFHLADDAAKICVVHLVRHLQERGFILLDCQQRTEHMVRFGAVEISDREYARLLSVCVQTEARF